ncbi:MAG: hypothetical protein CVU00_02595 [Bacteroidetes bacterium HGW-Bacteroidetes-17]|jgi:hypothetical protein|nr:MAG: hypothetical protein CVU00_02595 [Bacteroidetes bacterium HGW-Bacteroidetes-17]
MKKHKKDLLFYEEIDNLISYMDDDIQAKMEFSQNFLKEYGVRGSDNTWVWMGLIRFKTLKYFIYSIVTEYDYMRKQSEIMRKKSPGVD